MFSVFFCDHFTNNFLFGIYHNSKMWVQFNRLHKTLKIFKVFQVVLYPRSRNPAMQTALQEARSINRCHQHRRHTVWHQRDISSLTFRRHQINCT